MGIGLLGGAAAFLMFSFGHVIYTFYAAAALVGLVQGGATSMSAVVLIDRTFPDNPGSAMGIAMSGSGVCSVAMSLILPTFIEHFGWSNGYRLQAVLWSVSFGAAMLLVHENMPDKKDLRSSENSEIQQGTTYQKATHDIKFYLFCGCVAAVCGFMVFLQHMPAFFMELGNDSAMAGRIMSVFSISMILCKISLGAMFDRLGAIRTTWAALLAYACSFWLMLAGNFGILCVGAALAAFGMSSTTVLLPLITKYTFGSRDFARIWSVVTMANVFGTAVGSPMWGAVYDKMGSYKTAVQAAAVFVIVIAIIMTMLMKNRAWKDQE